MAEGKDIEPGKELVPTGGFWPELHKQTRGDLVDCIQVLEALTASTEDEFLFIGSKLRGFYDRAVNIAEHAYATALLMSGDEVSKTIDGLRSVVGGMTDHLKKTDTEIGVGIEKLKHIAEIIGDINEQMDGLLEITRSLRTLGISTIIQNASLRRPDAGIQVLGRDVQKLSASIFERSSSIGSDMRKLNEVIRNSLLNLSLLQSGQKAKAGSVLKNTVSSTQSLERKYDLSSSAARLISESSAEISARIGRIVTSLQFHDITRQLFDSSKTELKKLFPSDQEQCGDMAQREPQVTFTKQFYRDVVQVCGREAAALVQGRDTFSAAVNRVLENLEITSISVRETVDEIGRLAKADNSNTGSFLLEIEAVLSSVMSTVSALSESAMVKNELSGAVLKVAGVTEEISGLIRGIEEIGEEVELISFNASIKADHIGGEGRPLGVISDFIQRISANAQTYTNSISGSLKSMASSADQLLHEISLSGKKSENEIEIMSGELRRMVTALRALNKNVISSFAEINETGRGLSKEIDEVRGKIAVHSNVEYAVNSILAILRRITSSVRGLAAEPVSDNDPDGLPHLPLETAMPDSGGKPLLAHKEFGNNVELF